jgi:threonine dehydrogenase-like Zn-dependent dehydrogenase
MKAIALKPGTNSLRLAEIPEPHIQKDSEIKARVLSVGICGTDREEAAGGRADAPPGATELIIGHEMVAQVTEIGKKVSRVRPGDFVVITVRRGCNSCIACKSFRSDLCLTGNYTERGIKGLNGFQAEYVVDDEIYAVKVPSSIAHVAVLTEPCTVVEKAIEEAAMIQVARLPFLKGDPHWYIGKTAVVAGLGPIGLLAALVLSLRGAHVIGLDRAPNDSSRAKLLEAMGGKYVNDSKLDPEEFCKKYPDVKFILDAAGVAKLDFDLLDLLGQNGVFVLTGVPGAQRLLEVDGAKLMRKLVLKNQVMVGSVNEGIDHFAKALQDFEAAEKKWPGLISQFITHRFAYTDFQKALTQHNANEIKAIIDWSASHNSR